MSKLEILLSSYQENFKFAKDLAFIYPAVHPKRKKMEKVISEMEIELQKIHNGKETKS